MKVLIIGPLGAGKSSLAYEVSKRYGLNRLNIDEVCRNPADGSYYPQAEQFFKLQSFLEQNSSWVAEGCQKILYEKMFPDVIIDMRVNRLVAIWRFTLRFFKAKKLIGKKNDKSLPVQAYHYRKPTFKKIKEYDAFNKMINMEIGDYLRKSTVPVVMCKSFQDYKSVFECLDKLLRRNSF